MIPQHGRLKGELLGKRQKIGRIDTGIVYEQELLVGELRLRRVTVELDEPTRDGDHEIHILSNVPQKKADACQIATVYRQRWEIENGFHTLTTALKCEVESLGHPLAALFVFCTAMLACNGMRALPAALIAAFGRVAVEELSTYSLSQEIAKAADGLAVILTPDEWDTLLPRTPQGLARFLIDVTIHVDLERYQKSRRGPIKKPPPRTGYRNGGHVSTAKILGIISS